MFGLSALGYCRNMADFVEENLLPIRAQPIKTENTEGLTLRWRKHHYENCVISAHRSTYIPHTSLLRVKFTCIFLQHMWMLLHWHALADLYYIKSTALNFHRSNILFDMFIASDFKNHLYRCEPENTDLVHRALTIWCNVLPAVDCVMLSSIKACLSSQQVVSLYHQ